MRWGSVAESVDVPDGRNRAKLMAMKSSSPKSTNPLIAKIDQFFNRDLALENDYLRQENRILRSKLGRRVPLTEADRRTLVKYGLRIKDRLRQIVAIAKPETLLAWNRRQTAVAPRGLDQGFDLLRRAWWKAQNLIRLGKVLESLGMKFAFDEPEGSANFDRMAPRKADDYLFVSAVFHETFLTLDEKGTEAATATAVAMMCHGHGGPENPSQRHIPLGRC